MIVEAKVVGSQDAESQDVPVPVDVGSLRDLIVLLVRHELAAYEQRRAASRTLRVLTPADLADETATMLGLTNVEVGGHHVRVKCALGTYSIHLGSGVVHRIPGNAVHIVPVSAQHRGRIFLPFADDDPRTAEIMAKLVLLARDDEIKDPTILQQLVG